MGYFYLLLQAVIFSFGGLMIKAAGTMFSPFLISCLRLTDQRILLRLHQRRFRICRFIVTTVPFPGRDRTCSLSIKLSMIVNPIPLRSSPPVL